MKFAWEWYMLAIIVALIGTGIGAMIGDTLAWMAGLGDEALHPVVFAVGGGVVGYRGIIWLARDTYRLVYQPQRQAPLRPYTCPYYS